MQETDLLEKAERPTAAGEPIDALVTENAAAGSSFMAAALMQ